MVPTTVLVPSTLVPILQTFVGVDYFCESGKTGSYREANQFYYEDL